MRSVWTEEETATILELIHETEKKGNVVFLMTANCCSLGGKHNYSELVNCKMFSFQAPCQHLGKEMNLSPTSMCKLKKAQRPFHREHTALHYPPLAFRPCSISRCLCLSQRPPISSPSITSQGAGHTEAQSN